MRCLQTENPNPTSQGPLIEYVQNPAHTGQRSHAASLPGMLGAAREQNPVDYAGPLAWAIGVIAGEVFRAGSVEHRHSWVAASA